MAGDAILSWRTRGMGRPEGKPRVFLTCHPDDIGRYLDEVCGYILDACDCAVYYTEDMGADLSSDNSKTDLGRMNLFVVPVSFRLLTTPNRAMDADVPFAREHHIAILPLMMEPGIEKFYSEPKRFGELQYLEPHAQDVTSLSFDEKLRTYLDSLLVDRKLVKRIRAAFDAYVFLSYRKKDRALANDLMRTIHAEPSLEDVAVWFDEYLTPGESFRENIARLLEESRFFALLVTPSLLEMPGGRPNFVMGEEYPAAVAAGKDVLPAEAAPTDLEVLKAAFPGIPELLDLGNPEGRERFLDALRAIAISEDDSPEHNYLIGLAYLGGIDVERDPARAVRLLELSADEGFPDAMSKLYEMYCKGEGVTLDYGKAHAWAEQLYEQCKRTLSEEESARDNLAKAAHELAHVCMRDHDMETALEKSREALEIRRELAAYGGESARGDLAKEAQDHAVILRRYGFSHSGVQTSEVDAFFRESLDIARELAEDDPAGRLADVALYANNYAVFLTRLPEDESGDAVVEQTRGLFDEALRIREQLASVDPGAYLPDVAWSETCYGNFLRVTGLYDEAKERYERSLELRRRLAGNDPDAFEGDVAWSLNNLGGLYMDMKRPADAEWCHREALEIYERLMRVQPSNASRSKVARTYEFLESAIRNQGRSEEADELREEATRLRGAV